MTRVRRQKRTFEDYAVDIFSYVFMLLLALIIILPFMNVVSKAFSQEWAVVSGKVGFLPEGFQLDTMKFVVSSRMFMVSFGNSVLTTIIGAVSSLLVSGMAAYSLSKKHLPGMKFVMMVFLFTMFFSGGMIPSYLLMRDMKLLNTFPVLILPGIVNIYHLLIIKNHYETLPESLEESARIDGANNIITFFFIIVPLSLPIYATIGMFTAVLKWNDYFSPMLYILKTELKTLPLYLRDVITDATNTIDKSPDEMINITTEGVQAASLVASTVPILLVYPFLQKYFIKGVLVGSVKG